MRINNNISALNTYNKLGLNATGASKSMEKLSSGLRINRASDDAAGLAISEKMRAQIKGLNQAARNALDAISLIQTAEGALSETHSILQRMRELAVQAANDTNTATDRLSLQAEIEQLVGEIDRIGNSVEFNTMKLLNGDKEGVKAARDSIVEVDTNTANSNVKVHLNGNDVDKATLTNVVKVNIVGIAKASQALSVDGLTAAVISYNFALGSAGLGVTVSSDKLVFKGFGTANDLTVIFSNYTSLAVGDTITIGVDERIDATSDGSSELVVQIGANSSQEMRINMGDMRAAALDLRNTSGKPLSVRTKGEASASLKLVNIALERVSSQRSKLGAYQNRLEHTIANLQTSSENLSASESRIRDVDMAFEMMNFTKYNILNQAATAMLAQANMQPQSVLQLLR